jgi:hypothetical protein
MLRNVLSRTMRLSLLAGAALAVAAMAGAGMGFGRAAEAGSPQLIGPDVRVRFLGSDSTSGLDRDVTYKLVISNIGMADAHNVLLARSCHFDSVLGDQEPDVIQPIYGNTFIYQNIGMLKPGAFQVIWVRCQTPDGFVAHSAQVTALVSGDADTANNTATSPDYLQTW